MRIARLGVGAQRDVGEAHLRARGAGEQRLEAGPVQRRAAPERIEDQRFGAAVDADQEVPRETDARGAEAETAGDLEVEDRQGDRDADPPGEHLGEKAVAGIVVVVRVAAKAELGEQPPGQRAPGLVGLAGGVDGRRRSASRARRAHAGAVRCRIARVPRRRSAARPRRAPGPPRRAGRPRQNARPPGTADACRDHNAKPARCLSYRRKRSHGFELRRRSRLCQDRMDNGLTLAVCPDNET